MSWQHQSIIFDLTADLTGTGNRSEEVMLLVYDSKMPNNDTD